MAIEKLIPMLYTKEIKETVGFYVNVIGFPCNNYQAGNGWLQFGQDI